MVIWAAAILLLGATAKISGPSQAAPGDLVVLDASESQANGLSWLLVSHDRSFLTVEGNKKLIFATGKPGKYIFVLVAGEAAKDNTPPQVAIAKHIVEVSSPGPDPVPPNPPGPDPPVPPPAPPGPTPVPPAPPPVVNPFRPGTIAAFAWDSAYKLPAQAKAESSKVAAALEGLAAAIAAGGVPVSQIPSETRKALDGAYGAHKSVWQPWDAQVQGYLRTLSRDGKLVGVQGLADAYMEIAQALKAVK